MSQAHTRQIVALAGGPSHVGRVLGISRQAVNKWHKVPLGYVPDLSIMSGVSREVIRPDVYGPKKPRFRVRAQTRAAA